MESLFHRVIGIRFGGHDGGRPGPLVTTALVIAEAGYLLDRNLGPAAETALLDMICDDSLIVEDLSAADWLAGPAGLLGGSSSALISAGVATTGVTFDSAGGSAHCAGLESRQPQ